MNNFRVTTNSTELDIPGIHRFLSQEAPWAKGLPFSVLQKGIENSLCFAGFIDNRQIAFARVVSDYATFANLLDVFVLPEYRGKGYSKILMQEILAHPELQGLRRFTLATSDAHALYAQFGFESPAKPQTLMERYFPTIYLDQQESQHAP